MTLVVKNRPANAGDPRDVGSIPGLGISLDNGSHLNFFIFLCIERLSKSNIEDFPGGPLVKNPPANGEDMGLIPGPARFHMLQGD